MSNDYFNPPATPVDFTVARGAAIRALFAAVASGFDKFPGLALLRQGRINYAIAGGTENALTATFSPAPESLIDGATFKLKIGDTPNNAAATLNINALGAKAIIDSTGDALTGGELSAERIMEFVYSEDADKFQILGMGPPGPKGDTGPPGPLDGSTILNGTTNPAPGDGADGDFYIKVISGVPSIIYGPKAGGAWPAGTTILGADGADGTDGADGLMLRYGAGAPAGGDGQDGEFWIKTTAPVTIYGPKAGGVWPAGVSLKGDQGIQGIQGDPGVVDTTDDFNFTGLLQQSGADVGDRDLLISRTEAANFTLAAADRGKAITYTDTGDTCTVPLNSSVPIGVGAIIHVLNIGSGALAIAREGATVMKLAGTGADANRSLAVGGLCWLWKISTNTWIIGGDAT